MDSRPLHFAWPQPLARQFHTRGGAVAPPLELGLGDQKAWGGDVGIILLLGFVGLSGLALYTFGATVLMPAMLAVHLGAVLTFFLLTPFTKMAHEFYRLAALVRDAQRRSPKRS